MDKIEPKKVKPENYPFISTIQFWIFKCFPSYYSPYCNTPRVKED